ncbi:MAG: ABC transporter ATP-binding protein [Pararobbsia sp.]
MDAATDAHGQHPATSPPPALRIESLRVAYRDSNGDAQFALDELSFSIARGEAYGLVGESGSGKSTVAMAVARYLARNARVAGGRIELAGRDVAALGPRALREMRARDLSLVYQDPARALNPTLTIGRQLVESFELMGRHGGDARRAAHDMLERVQLPAPARAFASYPHQLSGGMQQRVVIAMALAKQPVLLILDEATTGLDATVEAEIVALLQTLRRASDTALLFISHKLPLVAELCDRIGVLERGRLVEEGAPQQVFAHPGHPYTAALLACLPGFGRTKRDGPLATLDEARAPDRNAARAAPIAAASAASVLRIDGIGKTYRIGADTLHALERVSLEVRRGETLGIVGESGSGKTTLARIIAGLVEADTGAVTLDGQPLPARVERRGRAQIAALQSVFQNPHNALNRAHRLRTLLGRAVGRLARLRGQAREARIRALLDAVRLPHARLSARARELSGGQQQRVAIARAFAGEPRVLICDEPTSALDVSVQAAILNLLVELQQTRQVAYLFISHDLAVIRYIADRVVVLYRGQIVETAPADALFKRPCHPYTETLLGARPAPRRTPARDTPAGRGCLYANRCAVSLGAQCEQQVPADFPVGEGHVVRCHLFGPGYAR